MRPGRRNVFAAAFGACALSGAAAACDAVLGIHTLAGGGPADGALVDSTGPNDGSQPPADRSAPDAGAERSVPDAGLTDTSVDAPVDVAVDTTPCDPDATGGDPHNCGQCGHDCQGGACEGGTCEAVQVAISKGTPTYLAVAGDSVYWTETQAGSLATAPKSGGNPTYIIYQQAGGIAGLAVDAERLYWGNNNNSNVNLTSCPLATCGQADAMPPTTMTMGLSLGSLDNVALADGSLLSAAAASGQIVKCPVGAPDSGPCVTMQTSLPGPFGIATDSIDVYWGQTGGSQGQGSLLACPLGGCGATPTPLVANRLAPTLVAVDATNLYWIENPGSGPGSVYECVKTNCGGGSGVTTLASALANPQGIAVDATYVYWSNQEPNGNVQRCPISGCGGDGGMPTTITTANQPFAVSVDDVAVYWTSSVPGGGVWKVAK